MEFLMSIKTRIAALALAALAVTGGIASSTTQAEAKGLGRGIGAGLLGAAVVGSVIAANSGYYNSGYDYDGYRHCGWVRQIVDPASGTGASSTPCRTRPARLSPRAGHLFECRSRLTDTSQILHRYLAIALKSLSAA
jgi:hypothetical protein